MTAPAGRPAQCRTVTIHDGVVFNVGGSSLTSPSVATSVWRQTYGGVATLSKTTVLSDTAAQESRLPHGRRLNALTVDTAGSEVFGGVVGGGAPP